MDIPGQYKEIQDLQLQEWNERELQLAMTDAGWRGGVLVTTPWCGTCQVSEKMLAAVQASGSNILLRKLNINYAPTLRDKWQIASVPCLVLLQGERVLRKEYTMHGAGHLYQILQDFEEMDPEKD